jgi:hypothetical protein
MKAEVPVMTTAIIGTGGIGPAVRAAARYSTPVTRRRPVG